MLLRRQLAQLALGSHRSQAHHLGQAYRLSLQAQPLLPNQRPQLRLLSLEHQEGHLCHPAHPDRPCLGGQVVLRYLALQ